jgi:hypothetical protein
MKNLERVFIWGCGNFELEWPHRLFANRAIHAGRLHARPWGERLKPASLERWQHMKRETWRAMFAAFAESLAGEKVYITVDMDCLAPSDSVTNWESGLFTAEEIAWALREVNATAEIIGGDVCGAYSPLKYARFFQRMSGNVDHPKLTAEAAANAAEINLRTLGLIWPELTQTIPTPEVDKTPAAFPQAQ